MERQITHTQKNKTKQKNTHFLNIHLFYLGAYVYCSSISTRTWIKDAFAELKDASPETLTEFAHAQHFERTLDYLLRRYFVISIFCPLDILSVVVLSVSGLRRNSGRPDMTSAVYRG